jgi:6-pyruvoyltetrahydropterin/6-carboxytetrahydropterin synthase
LSSSGKSIVVGVEGFSFDAAHYTRYSTEKCLNLHGHTYRVNVRVEGVINEKTGMVIDFLVLKKIVKEVIDGYDHKIIIPRRDAGRIRIEGPFNVVYKIIDYPEATTEYIALSIAREVYEKLHLPVTIELYEGLRNHVIVHYP